MKIKEGREEEYEKLVELNSKDPYSKRIVTYAEDWSRLMESEMQDGKALDEIAEATSQTADYDGITGFMYGAAVAALSEFWTHGDALRRWHNKKYGVHEDEEGVVNPSVITLGG